MKIYLKAARTALNLPHPAQNIPRTALNLPHQAQNIRVWR